MVVSLMQHHHARLVNWASVHLTLRELISLRIEEQVNYEQPHIQLCFSTLLITEFLRQHA